MLQYPIDVYPDNVAVDKYSELNDRRVHFTFKGDFLKAFVIRFYDYNSGNVVSNDAPVYDFDDEGLVFKHIGYNNTTVYSGAIIGNLPQPKSLIMQMMLIEGSRSVAGVDPSRFVLRGRLEEGCESGSTTIKIENKINNIYEWDLNVTNVRSPFTVTENDRVYDLNVMSIVINGQKIKINSYDYNTGELVLNSGVSSELDKGTAYEIYSNYLVTEEYYFETDTMPELPTVYLYPVFDSTGIHFKGACTGVLDYYTITMQKKKMGFNDEYFDIAQTDKIYSQNIEYNFVDDYDYDDMGGNSDTRIYRFIVNAKTQNGFYITGTSNDWAMPVRENTEIATHPIVEMVNGINTPKIQWREPSGVQPWHYRVYRIDAEEMYALKPYKQLVYDNKRTGFDDFSASNHGVYKYMIVPYDPNGDRIAKAIITDTFTCNQIGYTITSITDQNINVDSKPFYLAGNTWTFLVDIDNTTVTQNLDNTLHVGYGKYSSKTSTNVNYASGSMSAYLGELNCMNKKYTDTIKLVQEWRKFISQDCQFILRSQKGDVWMVNIVDNPTTEYQEDVASLPTKFTFSWAECGSIDDILFDKDLPPRYEERD